MFVRTRNLILLSIVLALLIGCGSEDSSNDATLPEIDSSTAIITTPPNPLAPATPFQAGVAKVDATPNVGVPLAGYSNGRRRLLLPDINPFNDYTFFRPSEGILDPIFAKALVLDNGKERICLVTLDAIAMEGAVAELAHQMAQQKGFSLPLDKVMLSSSHTHSGPGAASDKTLWQYLALDLFVASVRNRMANKISEAMVQAENNLVTARIGTGIGQLRGVTKNRRADESPNFKLDDIDDQLGIIRVDRLDGTPLATVWNFAIHGTALRTKNMKYSADIMGAVNRQVEQTVGGVALFINGAEGDIAPKNSGTMGMTTHAKTISEAVKNVRQNIIPQSQTELAMTSEWVQFGSPTIDFKLVSSGVIKKDPLNIIEFLKSSGHNPGFKIPLNNSWVENRFRFSAIRIGKTLLVSVPGEPISLLGYRIRSDGIAMGYDNVFVCSLTNNHMAYIVTEKEYTIGGYEGLLTFFGPTTGAEVRSACHRVAEKIKP